MLNESIDMAVIISSKSLSTQWECRVKRKMWVNSDGFIVENASYTAYGKSVRLFYAYRNDYCYSKGLFFDDAANLRDAQVKSEKFMCALETSC